MKVGFFVNPLAGFGLTSNRKGSDGLKLTSVEESSSFRKAQKLISLLKGEDIFYYTPQGTMGSDILQESGVTQLEVITRPGPETTAKDTINFIEALCRRDAELIIFVGGDGTARDVLSANACDLPAIGVPAGIKMYSSVFSINVESASRLIKSISDGHYDVRKCEVVDIDEQKFGLGKLDIMLYGELSTPVSQYMVSQSKAEYSQVNSEGISEYLGEKMEPGKCYIIGPGSTCKSVLPSSEQQTNLLGVDILIDSKVVVSDADERTIFHFASERESFIIVSPIGGQNFLLGRGNRQISGRVVESVGWDHVWVISSQEKLREMANLFVDIDNSTSITIPKFIKVLYGYGRFKVLPVKF